MLVIKRDGTPQPIDFEKIHWRIKSMCATPAILDFQKTERPDAYSVFNKLTPIYNADVDLITKKTIEGVYNKIPTTEIDKLSAEIAQDMCTTHPDNSTLATRILVSNLQKNIVEIMLTEFPDVPKDKIVASPFRYAMELLYQNLNDRNERAPLVAPYMVAIARKYSDKINEMLDLSRDFTNNNYRGMLIQENGYLFRINSLKNSTKKKFIIETPGISEMRIAIFMACAPSPCPNYYENLQSFIQSNPHLVKEKHRSKINEINRPNDKRLVSEFKDEYWNYVLDMVSNQLEISDYQWSRVKEIYDGMSCGRFTAATPTRYAAGSLRPQGSSCFLIAMEDDSLSGIYSTLKEQSQISKHAGGVGIWVHNIRSAGSYIAGTNGISSGLRPMLQVFDASSRYVNQGGKRPGTVSVYIEPWHPDIITVIRLKRKLTSTAGASNLFYAMWIPDEFLRCWIDGKDWYLFDPAICPKLYDSYDEAYSATYLSDDYVNQNKHKFLFTYRYRKYVRQGKYESKISPNTIMEEIVETIETEGVPYMLSKDACNRKSNHKNIGVIKSANLCTEIVEYSDKDQTAVCNLHSICLQKFVRPYNPTKDNERFKYNVSLHDDRTDYWTFDFEEFAKTVRIVQKNIDRLIDANYYPSEKCSNSNMKSRPNGIGVQSEADMFAMLRIPWNSKRANELRFYIFERMYYEALSSSVELSKVHGSYHYFDGSPASKGKLQFDLWKDEGKKISFGLSLNWDDLKNDIKKFGLRNSLFISPMPTASTSDIMGNNPSIEPFNSLIYVKKAKAGPISIVNKNLVKDLMSIGLWNTNMSDKIIANDGSIRDIPEIPQVLRDAYLTVYDLGPSDIVDAASVRGWFVDQSQSMNLFLKNLTMAELSKAWIRGWKRGLKTLSYYCRTTTSGSAQKAQIESINGDKIIEKKNDELLVCSRDNPDCLSCGS